MTDTPISDPAESERLLELGGQAARRIIALAANDGFTETSDVIVVAEAALAWILGYAIHLGADRAIIAAAAQGLPALVDTLQPKAPPPRGERR